MSERVRELAERRAALQLRCAAERRAVASQVRTLERRLVPIDRMAAAARYALNPLVLAVGAAALLAAGRARAFRLLSRLLLLAAAGRRLLQAAKQL